jgi:hypothetical protein
LQIEFYIIFVFTIEIIHYCRHCSLFYVSWSIWFDPPNYGPSGPNCVAISNSFENQQNTLIKLQLNRSKHISYQVPTPTCFGTKVPSSGSFSATKFRRSESIPGTNPTDYKQLCKQPLPGILLDIRTFVVEKTP